MKSKAEKLKAQYEKSVDAALEKLIQKVTPLVHAFCDKYGVQFLAGNGVYGIATPEGDFGIVNAGFAGYSYGYTEHDNRWLIDHFDPTLSELLEIELLQRCSLGCQLENYTPLRQYENSYIWIKEPSDSSELEVRFQDSPSDDPDFDTFGPISKELTKDIFATYEQDNEVGMKLIFGCLRKV